jgi:hypothetical protein
MSASTAGALAVGAIGRLRDKMDTYHVSVLGA